MLASPVSERDALVASFCEVAEQSFFAFAEPLSNPAESGAAEVAEWIVATVRFHGAVDGAIRITLPAALGLDLCGAFLGSEIGRAHV